MKKYDVVLIQKPCLEGITKKEVEQLYELLKSEDAYMVDIGDDNGNACALGLISPKASENLSYLHTQDSEFGQFIAGILGDTTKESANSEYSFEGLSIWMGYEIPTEEKPAADDHIIHTSSNISYRDRDIDDIMDCAIVGGIGYWCDCISIVGGKKLGTYTSEQLSRGGSLKIHLDEPFDENDTEEYELTKEKFLYGLKKYIEYPNAPYSIVDSDKNGYYIEAANADAVVADMIVQYALFDEIIFG